MGRRSGYEYSYRFWVDDDIIPLYNRCLSLITPHKGFLFEIRTNFILKSVDDDYCHTMGSERFGAAVREDEDMWKLEDQTSFRLKDYWMSDNEILSLVTAATDFAKRQTATAAAAADVIPVVVGLDVCTVEEESESINAAIDRAIRPQCLIPIYVWPIVPEGTTRHVNEASYLAHKSLLWDLPRIRVEDGVGLALMEVCPVCSRKSVIGAQVSFFPDCGHACHSHCVFRWLRKWNFSCPVCDVRIKTDLERLRNSEATDDSLSCDSGSDSDMLSSDYGFDLCPDLLGSDSELDSDFLSRDFKLESLSSDSDLDLLTSDFEIEPLSTASDSDSDSDSESLSGSDSSSDSGDYLGGII